MLRLMPEQRRALRGLRGVRPFAWALGLTLALPAVLVGIGWLVLPHDGNVDQCQNFDVFCTLGPADGLLVAALVVGLPLCLIAAIVSSAAIAIAQAARRHRERTSPR